MVVPMTPAAPSSPCTRACHLDRALRLCRGCGRTGAEIAGWGRLSEPERSVIMAGLPARRAAAGLSPTGVDAGPARPYPWQMT